MAARRLIIIVLLGLASLFLFAGCENESESNYLDDNDQPDLDIPYEPKEADPGDGVEYVVEEYGEIPHRVRAVSAGSWNTLAVMWDGSLWGWGRGSGQWHRAAVGDGADEERLTPVMIDLDNVIHAVAGKNHSLALTADGDLWAWGGWLPHNSWSYLTIEYGNYGGGDGHGVGVGDGTTEHHLAPVKIMENVVYATIAPAFEMGFSVRSFAITEDGGLWAWGQNGERWWGYVSGHFHGFLGDGTATDQLSPVRILDNVVSVVPTVGGGFAVTEDGGLWGWGRRYRLEYNNKLIPIWEEPQLSPVQIMEDVAQVFTHYIHTPLVITTDGVLWELSEEPIKLMEDVVHAARGPGNFFAITVDGTLWAWGRNHLPSRFYVLPLPILGDGTLEGRDYPVKIMENVASIHIVYDVVFSITKNGELWGWSPNQIGQVGDGTRSGTWVWNPSEGMFGSEFILHGDEPRLSPVLILENIASISSAYFEGERVFFINTFAVTKDGDLWAWGGGRVHSAPLGDGLQERRIYPVQITVDGTLDR